MLQTIFDRFEARAARQRMRQLTGSPVSCTFSGGLGDVFGVLCEVGNGYLVLQPHVMGWGHKAAVVEPQPYIISLRALVVLRGLDGAMLDEIRDLLTARQAREAVERNLANGGRAFQGPAGGHYV